MPAPTSPRPLCSAPAYRVIGPAALTFGLCVAPALAGCASGYDFDVADEASGGAEKSAAEQVWSKWHPVKKDVVHCDYPQENVGTAVGKTVREQLVWTGFVDGSSSESEISIGDYLDCKGYRGVNALLVVQSATWCGACQQEAQDISQRMTTTWPGLGIRVITLMIEDIDASPATPTTALNWRNAFQLNTSVVAADPSFSFLNAVNGGVGLPVIVVVDPRTMKIVDYQEGYTGDHRSIEALAAENAR